MEPMLLLVIALLAFTMVVTPLSWEIELRNWCSNCAPKDPPFLVSKKVGIIWTTPAGERAHREFMDELRASGEVWPVAGVDDGG